MGAKIANSYCSVVVCQFFVSQVESETLCEYNRCVCAEDARNVGFVLLSVAFAISPTK